jgi:hypothetical protein
MLSSQPAAPLAPAPASVPASSSSTVAAAALSAPAEIKIHIEEYWDKLKGVLDNLDANLSSYYRKVKLVMERIDRDKHQLKANIEYRKTGTKLDKVPRLHSEAYFFDKISTPNLLLGELAHWAQYTAMLHALKENYPWVVHSSLVTYVRGGANKTKTQLAEDEKNDPLAVNDVVICSDVWNINPLYYLHSINNAFNGMIDMAEWMRCGSVPGKTDPDKSGAPMLADLLWRSVMFMPKVLVEWEKLQLCWPVYNMYKQNYLMALAISPGVDKLIQPAAKFDTKKKMQAHIQSYLTLEYLTALGNLLDASDFANTYDIHNRERACLECIRRNGWDIDSDTYMTDGDDDGEEEDKAPKPHSTHECV